MPIRTFRDLEAGNVSDGPQRAHFQQSAHGGLEDGANVSLMRPPQTEPMPPIKSVIAPRFSYLSFTFIISLVQVIMFITTLIVGQVKYDGAFVKSNNMLGPSAYTLDAMGAKDYYQIRHNLQIWRLLVPVFLHAGMLHIFVNLYTQCRIGFSLEKRWGWWRFVIVYFMTGIGASLLSANASHYSISVGASGALFGLLGAEVTYLAYNWEHTPDNSSEACFLFMNFLINMIILLDSSQSIDVYAHLGGFITGLLLTPFTLPAVTGRSWEFIYKGTGLFLSTGWFLLMFLLLFLRK